MRLTKLKIHLLQFSTVLGRPGETLKLVEKQVKKIALNPRDWLVFPEMWPSGFSVKGEKNLAAETAICLRWLQNFARRHRCYLSGSMLERAGSRAYNSAYVVDPRGRVLIRYRKIHLFAYGGEPRNFTAGKETKVVTTPWGKIGLAICYDLRFPELFRLLCARGAKLILIPSAWPRERLEHFLILLRARAIENQCYVIGVNKTGPGIQEKPVMYGGHSTGFGPWGEKLGELGSGPGVLSLSLDLDEVDRIRRRYPFLKSRVLTAKSC